jgi:hypothetical protein
MLPSAGLVSHKTLQLAQLNVECRYVFGIMGHR